jgi:hypothetical protein
VSLESAPVERWRNVDPERRVTDGWARSDAVRAVKDESLEAFDYPPVTGLDVGAGPSWQVPGAGFFDGINNLPKPRHWQYVATR